MSYVTVEEANDYVDTHYLPQEMERTAWAALGDDVSKHIVLVRAFDRIERLPFTGCKHDASQLTAFPRCSEAEVSERVKAAQIIEALHDPSINPAGAEHRNMRIRGVKSYSIGHLSETFDGAGSASYGSAINEVCAETISALAPYLTGGYRVV